jgi:hypothetical protein
MFDLGIEFAVPVADVRMRRRWLVYFRGVRRPLVYDAD